MSSEITLKLHAGKCRICDIDVDSPFIQYYDWTINEKIKTCSEKCFDRSYKVYLDRAKLMKDKRKLIPLNSPPPMSLDDNTIC